MVQSHLRPKADPSGRSPSTEGSHFGPSIEPSPFTPPSDDFSNLSLFAELPYLDSTIESSHSQPLTTTSVASRKARRGPRPKGLAEHRAEWHGSAFYEWHSADGMMTVSTIREGFWATDQKMVQLWSAIETEMDARQVLRCDRSNFKGKGAYAALKARQLEAVDAAIEILGHFREIMETIDPYRDYKTGLLRALRFQSLRRWSQRGTATPGMTRRDRSRKATTEDKAASTSASSDELSSIPTIGEAISAPAKRRGPPRKAAVKNKAASTSIYLNELSAFSKIGEDISASAKPRGRSPKAAVEDKAASTSASSDELSASSKTGEDTSALAKRRGPPRKAAVEDKAATYFASSDKPPHIAMSTIPESEGASNGAPPMELTPTSTTTIIK